MAAGGSTLFVRSLPQIAMSPPSAFHPISSAFFPPTTTTDNGDLHSLGGREFRSDRVLGAWMVSWTLDASGPNSWNSRQGFKLPSD